MAKEIAEEYSSSLGDLTLNSKPLINMLTMLADENIAHAEAIVEAVEKHLEKVRSEHKLPVLYLIDSIVKNVGSSYVTLFTHNIVNTFCSVFEKVDEKIRAQMFKLRQTWSDVFPAKKLYALDIRVQCIDPAWPITAPAPTPNIHVNPKFFNNPASTTPTATAPTSPVSLDPTTLDMQAQLINKHKELLELRQKKLELELLQAKAKLEEQQKQLQSVKLLTKSEVPKSVAISAVKPDDSKIPVKVASQVVSPAANKSSAPATNNSVGALRINPVNSAMLASVRPMMRDPRLRHQTAAPAPATLVASVAVPASQLSTPITSNNFETVNIDDKHKVKSKSHITIKLDCASNDKTSVNKAGAQSNTLTRKDPRLISNKVPGSAAGNKNKSNNGRSVSNERSPTKSKTNSAPSRKSSKSSSSSRSFKSTGPEHKVAVSSNNSTDGGASSSISSKNVKDAVNSKGINESSIKSSPSSSPNKYKKKTEHSSPRSDKSAADQKRSKTSTSKSDSKRSRERLPGDKYEDENGRTTSPSPTAAAAAIPEQRTFKGLKGSTKNRNYMRRNRDVSVSPEPNKDVDLRLGAPPEKQARLQLPAVEPSEEVVKSTTVDDIPSNKDVDLRTLVVPAAVSKKRSSTEKLEASNAKKSKSSQIFDVLFGNEDVDLRQLPPVLTTTTAAPVSTQAAVVRPPTPPPPIISSVSSEKQEIKTKDSKSSLDAIRAKLANATKKSFNNEIIRKNSEDTDMRLKQSVFSATDSAEDVLQKIIISQADEQLIKNGNLSQALVEKVLTLFETQKLQEAQRRESEEVKHNDLANTTLTPISDDELSVDFSHSDSEDDAKTTRKSDSDERVPPPAPVISQNANSDQSKEQNKTHSSVDPRLSSSTRSVQQNQDHTSTNTAWHGNHRRRRPKTHWDSPPPPHSGPEPWLRPPPAVLSQAMYGPRRPFPPFSRPAGENFAPRMDAALPVVPPHILESTRTSSPPTIGSQNTKELPMADPLVLEYIEQDTMRTINIDGRPREIRYYDENAIVIMSWDDPREISFQNGTRLITFDDKESFTLSFNDTYRDVTIAGKPHRIRLGTPTRELYIDGKWYECFFGGPGIGIEVDGKMHVVKMDGPPPHVKIGTVKRTDLVAGKINLIINARTMVPVFLDAKPQKFDIEGKIHTLRFVDALRTVLINEVPFKVEFGGLPKPITVHDKKHFIRFSVLPRGIKPGYVNIANMEGHRFPSPPRNDKESSNDATALDTINNLSGNEPALPMLGKRRIRPADHDNSPDSSSRNSPIMHNPLQHLGSLDVLSSIMTSPMANNSSNVTGYQVDNTQDSQDGFPCVINKSNDIPGLTTNENSAHINSIPFLPSSLNINELFQKLVATGIVTTAKDKTPPPPPKPREDLESFIKPVLFGHPETLKIRQAPLITALYSGMQCSSCGVRFPPEHSMQYSQHLDWHFRQNRRGRNSARKALCRKWYYDVTDWKNFEEIEDIEEREKNWFESQQQQQQAEGAGEDGDEEIEIPSVPSDSNSQDTRCEVCHDKFEQFYNEEKEEWHLRMAIREDGKTYHPLCYDDYKTSMANLTFEDTLQNTTVENNEVSKEDENEELKAEDKLELKEEETEEKITPEVEDKLESVKTEEEDDDVIIQEPKVEQIEIDDAIGDENELGLQTESNDGLKTDDDIVLPGNIRIKEEPMDDEGFCISNIKTEPLDHEMEDNILSSIPADTTHCGLVSSIDGNVQCSAPTQTPTSGMTGKIKINITKPIMTPKEHPAPVPAPPKEQESLPEAIIANNEPLPPGEEPVQLNLKPALQGLTLTKQPPVSKGTELTGLCSIM